MKNFRAITQRFRKSRRATRHNHEFLKINRGVRMSAAVQDIHHRHRQNSRLGPAKIAKEEQIFRGRSGVRDRQGDAKQRVCPQVPFIGRAVELDQLVVDLLLVPRIPAFKSGSNLIVDVGDCLLDTFAAESRFIAIPQFPCFMFAGTCSAWNRRPAKRAALQSHINFDSGIAA